jgi:hypothetical protein
MNIGFFFVSVLFLLYSIRHSFFWWFQSEEYLTLSKKQRRQYRKTLFFMPQVLMFDFYDNHSKLEKWLNRIIGLIFLVAALLGMYVGINGPFVLE